MLFPVGDGSIGLALLRLLLQAEATADEAAQEASFEAAAKWEAQVEQLQVRYIDATLASCLLTWKLPLSSAYAVSMSLT